MNRLRCAGGPGSAAGSTEPNSLMEEHFPQSSLDDEHQGSKTEDQLSLPDLNQDTYHKDPESLKQDPEQQSLQVQVPDRDSTQDEAEHVKCDPDPPQEQLEGQGVDQNPAEGEDLLRVEQDQDQDQRDDLDAEHQGHTVPDQDQDRDRDRDLTAANEEAAGESGGGVPALVITEAEERPAFRPAGTPAEPAEPPRPQRPADLVIPMIPVVPPDPGLSCSSDGGDMACSDLLSLRSDSLSLASEPTASRTSEEDDSRSVTTSSVMSLFHRVQLDPLEKHWWRSSALGNMAAQRQLLAQEPSLVLKKDFVSTALHWAAKQGRQDATDMMLQSGADVNARAGYTALHLASIHGHQHVVHALINTHNAKSSLRDYHGKTAVHYWSGCTDVFTRPDAQSGGTFSRGRRTQRYALPALLLTRSRSQGQLNLEFGTPPQSASHDLLDLHL